ncbi:MAG: replicative DNA helicase [Oligoflexia bacterium]|nr:replicative DNA helicase [Oligoflexia bacterium]
MDLRHDGGGSASNFGQGFTFSGQKNKPSAPSTGARIPPHNTEAEIGVIGGILLENRALDTVVESNLNAEDFYSEAHRIIFQTILDLTRKGQPADILTVKNALSSAGNLEKVGGISYISEFVNSVYSAANIAAYAQIVREKSIERKIIHVCSETEAKAYSGVEDHNSFKEDTEKKLLEATSDRKLSTYSSLSQTMLEVFNHLQETASRDTKIIGVPSGFRDLDHETMGWHPGQLIIVAARPGMGKTSFMLNTALNAAIQSNTHVAFFSMEMSKHELTMRLLSMEAKVDSNRLKNASRLHEQDWKNLQMAGGLLEAAPFFMDDTPALNLLELKSRCRRIQNQHSLGLVVVDYLQLMRGLGSRMGASSREQEIAEISRGLKALAKELSVPVIAASQLSREVERRERKKPQLSDLRESGAIEQDADLVLFIHRDKENPDLQNEAELIIGKHRSGNTGEIKLAWIGQHTTFKDFAYGGDPQGGSPVPDIF